MIYTLWLIVSLYAIACFWLCWQWLHIPKRSVASIAIPSTFRLSVIIPVRNEGSNIGVLLADLEQQSLPKIHFEVIIADDASTDDTALIVSAFQKETLLDLKLISLEDTSVSSPKKRAISQSIKIANGELIVTTDGDCRMTERWLDTIVQTYLQTGAKFISGPVTFLENSPLSGRVSTIFQTIEFASLIGTGACLMEAGQPTMCNGANLAYQHAVFEEVGGYEGIDQIASGDDEFLLQKISRRFPDDIYFLKSHHATVRTQAQPNWKSFYQQRVRWASKWAVNGRIATMAVAIFVFLVNSVTLALWITIIQTKMQEVVFVQIIALKLLPEFLFLALVVKFLGRCKLLLYIPLVQLFYPFYVLFFGIAAQRKGYEWKGRQLK